MTICHGRLLTVKITHLENTYTVRLATFTFLLRCGCTRNKPFAELLQQNAVELALKIGAVAGYT